MVHPVRFQSAVTTISDPEVQIREEIETDSVDQTVAKSESYQLTSTVKIQFLHYPAPV